MIRKEILDKILPKYEQKTFNEIYEELDDIINNSSIRFERGFSKKDIKNLTIEHIEDLISKISYFKLKTL